jgi:mRNA deadenylase 3'-5' endonuclease subunit Ccr4
MLLNNVPNTAPHSIFSTCKITQIESKEITQSSHMKEKFLKLIHDSSIINRFNETSGSPIKLTIMTYNTLAQTLMNRRESFHYVSKQAGRWKNRRQLLMEEIKDVNADVICMQEVDFFEDYWKEEFEKLGYKSVHQPKTTSKREIKRYGLCVAWKSDLLELVDYKLLEYQNLSEHLTGLKFFELCKSNVAQICAFRVKNQQDNYGFVIANTHAFWRKNYAYTRLRQLLYLLDNISTFNEERNWPIVTMGDFNMTPSSVVYQILTGKREFTRDDPLLKELLLPKDLLENTTFREIQELKRNQLEKEDKKSDELPKSMQDVKDSHHSLEWWLDKVHFSLHDHSIFDPEQRLNHVMEYLKHRMDNLPVLHSVFSQYCELDDSIYPIDKRPVEWLEDGVAQEPPYTHYVDDWCGTLDYFLLVQDCDMKGFKNQYPSHILPSKIAPIPHEEEVTTQTALPNESRGSDHVPLITQLKIKPVASK